MASVDITNMKPTKPFIRSRLTWLTYIYMAYFGFGISIQGPLMPFIATKLGLTFTEIGYHFMIGGAGGIITALIGEKLVRRYGNHRTNFWGAVLAAVSLLGIVYGSTVEITLLSTLLFSIGGGFTILVVTATIAEIHPTHSAKAFTEVNIVGGIGTIVGPAIISLLAASALGWESSGFTRLIFLASIILIFRGVSLDVSPPNQNSDSSEKSDSTHDEPLPPLFWAFGILLLLGIAIEFLIMAWSATFLTTIGGFTPDIAAALVSLFAIATLLGRILGRRLLEVMSANQVLLLSLISALVIFPIFWLSTVQWLTVVGIFLFGIGLSNVNPLIQSGAMLAAGKATNRASARLMFFPSIGNLVMLQLMGILSDMVGIDRAYAMEIVLIVIAIGILVAIMRQKSS